MIPREREDRLYKSGKRCEIAKEEGILFEYLDKISDRGSRVLDIGAGSGDITYKIKEKGFSVTGVDFSEEVVKLTRGLGLNCLVVDLDNGIPFDDGVFDIVWAGDIIEHLFDPIFVLKEVNRVLAPGGALLCTIQYDLKITTRLTALLGQSYQESVYRKYGQYKHHTFFRYR
jgi:SAM-dependent methyltransferase